MSNWIELNLPYYYFEAFDISLMAYPDLSKRCKEQLGITRDDVDRLYKKLPNFSSKAYNSMSNVVHDIDKQLNQEFPERNREWRTARVNRLVSSNNKHAEAMGRWLAARHLIEDWEEVQPEIIAYDKEYKEKHAAWNESMKKKSFSGLGLDKPGTLIEVKIGDEIKQYLIGHINPLRGVCDDCVEFDKDVTVLKYKTVWSDETT